MAWHIFQGILSEEEAVFGVRDLKTTLVNVGLPTSLSTQLKLRKHRY